MSGGTGGTATVVGSRLRPRFHLTPRSGWINDPHGLVHHGGRWHVFTQSVPDATGWRVHVHWGHATGPDLLGLTEEPLAIAPGDGDDGIWTGCLVTGDDGRVRVFYTAVTEGALHLGRVRVAVADDDDLSSWTKGEVVLDTPAEPAVTAFRDPVVHRRDGRWWMTVGAELTDGRAAALAWSSEDLDTWQPEGVAASRPDAERDPWTGTLWECPQVVDVGDRQVLVTSVWAREVSYDTAWAVGGWHEGRFEAEHWADLSAGTPDRGPYAPSAFTDVEGRPALVFWLRGVTGPADDVSDPDAAPGDDGGPLGWAGAISVPWRVELVDDRPRLTVHPDVAAHAGDPVPTGTVAGLAALVDWTPASGDRLVVRAGDAADSAVTLTVGDDALVVAGREAPTTLPWAGGAVHVVVDGPVVEVVAPGGITAALLRPDTDDLHVSGDGDLVVRPLR